MSERRRGKQGLVIDRRAFLGLAVGGAAGWLAGCGDDGTPVGSMDGSTGGDTTGGTSGVDATSSTGPDGTGTSSSAGSDDGSSGTDTGTVVGCEGTEETFDAEGIPAAPEVFPLAIMAGEMQPESAMFSTWIPDAEPKILRVWRPGETEVTIALVTEMEVVPNADGYLKVSVDGLCPGTWYRYAYFVGEPGNFTARSRIGEFRTAIAEDALEPLTLAVSACNGDAFDWPALDVTADEYYDMFIHLGDMAYNDGAFSREEYRQIWRQYLGSEGFQKVYSRGGLYATWDDHEIDDNSNFDRETMDPMELEKRQNAMDAYFELLPIDAEGPDYVLWRSFRWGLTAEIIVLDCRYERQPSVGLYMSGQQMSWLKQRLADSPCHFKIIMNSVPITNMPSAWDVAASDRWEGYPASRNELLTFINDNEIDNVWFLGGDFHVCFVSRLEPDVTDFVSAVREIAVTGGNTNPVPELILDMTPPQFDYGVTQARSVLLTFDPESNAVNVRFIDPETGQDDYNMSLSYG